MFNLRWNPVGVLPKKNGGVGVWRLNTNLSAAIGNNVTDFFDPALCSVSYASFDDAINTISSLGKATLLCKMDLSSAICLLPIHLSDFCLLDMYTQSKFYIDKCILIGCSIACSKFEKFYFFLCWALAKKRNNPNIIHYLHDFHFVVSSDTFHCAELFLISVISLANLLIQDTTRGPITNLNFLG